MADKKDGLNPHRRYPCIIALRLTKDEHRPMLLICKPSEIAPVPPRQIEPVLDRNSGWASPGFKDKSIGITP